MIRLNPAKFAGLQSQPTGERKDQVATSPAQAGLQSPAAAPMPKISGDKLSQALFASHATRPLVRFGADTTEADFRDDEQDVVSIAPELIDADLQRPLIDAIIKSEKDGTLTLSHVFLALLKDPTTAKPMKTLLEKEYGIAPQRFETILTNLKKSWEAQADNRNAENRIPLVDRDYVETMDALREACTAQGLKIDLNLLLLSTFNQKGNVVGETMRALSTKAPSMDEEEDESALNAFSRDMNLAFELGGQAPVIGRDQQVADVLDIISQAKKGNPVLVGEAGVGKSAIVEKLAELAANGFAGYDDIPEIFIQRDEDGNPKMMPTGEIDSNGELVRRPVTKRILELNMDAIAAEGIDSKKIMGAVLKEAAERKDEVLLYVDELHKINDDNPSSNFANQLKPYLARGEVRLIGATTLDEYRQKLEKDPAISRRFVRIMVEEPTYEESMAIARGSRKYFEDKHGVDYRDETLEEAVTKSKRYLSRQQAPDGFIEVLDRAGAKKKNALKLGPKKKLVAQGKIRELDLNIKGWDNRLSEIQNDSEGSIRKRNTELNGVKEKLSTVKSQKHSQPKEYAALLSNYNPNTMTHSRLTNLLVAAQELSDQLKKQPDTSREALIEKIVSANEDLDKSSFSDGFRADNRAWVSYLQEHMPEQALSVRNINKQINGMDVLRKQASDKRDEQVAELKVVKLDLNAPTVNPVVTKEDVLAVIEEKTGIPLSKLAEDETERLNNMEAELGKRLIGQKPAIRALAEAIRKNRRGLSVASKPMGSFFFLGPTGTGKTELAKALAEFLFGDEKAITRIDMSEFQEAHTVSKLFGAPPGYVGYEEGGKLTNAVKERPSTVILLDELEKAHEKVFDTLLQVLDDGRMTDGKGNTIDFKNTVIIATSNIGSPELMKLFKDASSTGNMDPDSQAFKDTYANVQRRVKDLVKQHPKLESRPEFLKRFTDMVVFHALMRSHQTDIAKLKIASMNKKFASTDNKLQVSLTDDALEYLVDVGMDFEGGARPLENALSRYVESPIASRIGTEFHSGDKIVVTREQLVAWVQEADSNS